MQTSFPRGPGEKANYLGIKGGDASTWPELKVSTLLLLSMFLFCFTMLDQAKASSAYYSSGF